MSFRFLEHTADVRVECEAHGLPALFETAASAFYALTLKTTRETGDAEHEIELSGAGREDLLIRFLQELIFLLDAEHFVATQFDFHTIAFKDADAALRATVRGYRCAPEDRAEEVKSATYHGLDIEEDKGHWTAHVIFDL